MAKIPVRIVSAGTNVAGGLGHRSLGAPGAFVLEDDYGVANIAGGVIPMTQAEYAYAMGAQVVKDLGPTAWFQYNQGITVTGAGVSQWDDQSGNDNHLKQGTDTNRPFYATANALKLPGAAGAYASTPDSADVDFSDDIDVRFHLAAPDWTPAAINYLGGKYLTTGNQRTVLFSLATTGKITVTQSLDGTNTASQTSTDAVSFSNGAAGWIRFTRVAATGRWRFWESSDGSTFTELGATPAALDSGTLFDSTAVFEVGSFSSGGGGGDFFGTVYRVQWRNGIDGTLAVDFNPSDTTDGDTSFASSTTGEIWTINGTAYLYGVPGSILFDGVDNFLQCDAFTLDQPFTWYLLGKQITWTNGDHLMNGVAANTAVYQTNATPSILIFAGAAQAENTNFVLDTYAVVTALFNGASSLLQVNTGTAATGNPGASNPGGFTLGADNAGTGGFSNIQVKEAIVFAAAHTAAQRASVIAYLMQLGGL